MSASLGEEPPKHKDQGLTNPLEGLAGGSNEGVVEGAENENAGALVAGGVLASLDGALNENPLGFIGSLVLFVEGDVVGLGLVNEKEGTDAGAATGVVVPEVDVDLGMAKKSGTVKGEVVVVAGLVVALSTGRVFGVVLEPPSSVTGGLGELPDKALETDLVMGAAASGEEALGLFTPAASRNPRAFRTAVTSISFFFLGEGDGMGGGIATG